MDNLFLVFVCLIVGLLLQYYKAFPANSHQALNAFVIHVSLPAVALYTIPSIRFEPSLLFPVATAWITFACAFSFFVGLGKLLGWSNKLIACLVLTAGLGNTSFIGFPVIEALYGKEGIKAAILLDQPGTFLVMSTLGIAVATTFSNAKADVGKVIKKVVTFPPFIAFVVACLMNVFHLELGKDWQSVFQKIGMTVTPLALVSVGLQLKLERRSKHWRFLGLGLLYKLILIPAIIYALYVFVLGGKGIMIQVSIMEAAMAPMITAAIVASSYGLKPKLSSMMIGFGIPLSFLTLVGWYFLVKGI